MTAHGQVMLNIGARSLPWSLFRVWDLAPIFNSLLSHDLTIGGDVTDFLSYFSGNRAAGLFKILRKSGLIYQIRIEGCYAFVAKVVIS